jgi:hypothetical protein
MRNQVKQANRVLLVFTETYQRRFEGDEEEGKGLGVTFEGVIVTQWLYESAGRNAKCRPVVFGEEDEPFIPLELRRFNRYRIDTPENYEALLRWLHEAPRIVAPIVGQKPDLPSEPPSELFPSKPDEPRASTPEADAKIIPVRSASAQTGVCNKSPDIEAGLPVEESHSSEAKGDATPPKERPNSRQKHVVLRIISEFRRTFIIAGLATIFISTIIFFITQTSEVKPGDKVFLRSQEGSYVITASQIAKYNWPRLGNAGKVILTLLGNGPLRHGSVIQIQSQEPNLNGNDVLGAFADSHYCYYSKRGIDDARQEWRIVKLDASNPVLRYGDKIYLVNVSSDNKKGLTKDSQSADFITVDEEMDWSWVLEKK